MAKTETCYFSLSYGLAGCYMPDSDLGTYAVTRRKDMVEAVRYALAFYDMPKACLSQIKWRLLWGMAKRHGTSSIHLDIVHKGNALHFGGLTQAEYEEAQEEL